MKARDFAPPEHNEAMEGTDAERSAYADARRRQRLALDADRYQLDGLPPASPEFAIDPRLGFRVFRPGELPGADEIVDRTLEVLGRIGRPEVKGSKHIRKRLLGPEDLEADSPFMRFALSQPVISAVTGYLDVIPLLSYADIWFSGRVEGDLRSSQLYHCDGADVTQVKVFVYCNDVDLSAGPLTVIEADESERLRDRIGYRFANGRVSDDQMREHVGPAREHPLTGEAGTVCFVDTSRCFHYGSRVTDPHATRVLTMFQYLTPTAFILPDDLQAAAPFVHLASAGHSPLERLILGAAG